MPTLPSIRPAVPQRPRGVSLIELMVGMVIGLLATMVIAQVANVFEGSKRRATSGVDAQLSGALALDALQRDLSMAGYGLTLGGVSRCTEIRSRHATAGLMPNRVLAPVFITNGNANAPDTLEVLMSNSARVSVPIEIKNDHRRDTNTFDVDPATNTGLTQGEIMLAVPAGSGLQVTPNWCSIFNVSATSAAGSGTIQHDPGANGPWNQSVTDTVFPGHHNSDISYGRGGFLVPLGTLTSRIYQMGSNQAMQVQTFITGTATSGTEDLFPQIINLQAVYGKDTNGDGVADTWNPTQPGSGAEWQQVIAVRVAVVARSTQYEKCDPTSSAPEDKCPTTAAPTWRPDGVNGETLKVNHITDWQHFRYRVYETVVPLRNMIWSSPPGSTP